MINKKVFYEEKKLLYALKGWKFSTREAIVRGNYNDRNHPDFYKEKIKIRFVIENKNLLAGHKKEFNTEREAIKFIKSVEEGIA